MEMIFHSHASKTHFHTKGCALGLILKGGFLELGSALFDEVSILLHGFCTIRVFGAIFHHL